MDQKRAIEAFERYAGDYDPSNPMIRDKIVHTFHVAQIARRIAEGVTRPELVDFAWLLGLLHDIGRFEQVRRYGTFVDGQSVDHAELGADLLFREGLIDRFPADGLPEGWRRTAEAAIRLHNKLTLPEGLDGDDLALCRILLSSGEGLRLYGLLGLCIGGAVYASGLAPLLNGLLRRMAGRKNFSAPAAGKRSPSEE